MMIRFLGDTLDEFPGAVNQTRCFVHTVNLVAKSILRPFDTQNSKGLSEFSKVMQGLSDAGDGYDTDGVEEDTEDRDEEDYHDNCENEEDEDERFDDTSLSPIRSMLQKVCLRFTDHTDRLTCQIKMQKLASAIRNSMTLLLPAWYKMLSTQGLPPCMMPQDVSTRWNSTFDMLKFAI